ncbi:hypothetical protein [Mycolicibacterium fortuitum]|uniref:Uncharacterized protein n=1 Tax=Mycolicibacterium fortuitum TaxID=1766 RepID=A0AAE4VF50_MYCFO|nr:hypothetical protein [Mycolicibacterium fortuitum]MCV7137856.1 hypothetical protein [Mycolicibacterium fortuitum]MDV7193354.1 hypothetical protein [Mycolicibacterium fortuitum]MDV7205965.1 hypothetical protein [Mycolicibacterium fortuitum]MDV7227378.1 hypothetical protein [Mycolicibacterium fortuitum]MDV7259925.1 hypothetical protein [Mycolicibacterium fortuitum]
MTAAGDNDMTAHGGRGLGFSQLGPLVVVWLAVVSGVLIGMVIAMTVLFDKFAGITVGNAPATSLPPACQSILDDGPLTEPVNPGLPGDAPRWTQGISSRDLPRTAHDGRAGGGQR